MRQTFQRRSTQICHAPPLCCSMQETYGQDIAGLGLDERIFPYSFYRAVSPRSGGAEIACSKHASPTEPFAHDEDASAVAMREQFADPTLPSLCSCGTSSKIPTSDSSSAPTFGFHFLRLPRPFCPSLHCILYIIFASIASPLVSLFLSTASPPWLRLYQLQLVCNNIIPIICQADLFSPSFE